jgi:hypothetical protein
MEATIMTTTRHAALALDPEEVILLCRHFEKACALIAAEDDIAVLPSPTRSRLAKAIVRARALAILASDDINNLADAFSLSEKKRTEHNAAALEGRRGRPMGFQLVNALAGETLLHEVTLSMGPPHLHLRRHEK